MVEAKSMQLSSSKYKNPILASRTYFGVIEEIDYVLFIMPLVKCKWVDNNIDVQTDQLGFTQVDLGKATYMTEPFIMATQEQQVFYMTVPYDKQWSIVL